MYETHFMFCEIQIAKNKIRDTSELTAKIHDGKLASSNVPVLVGVL